MCLCSAPFFQGQIPPGERINDPAPKSGSHVKPLFIGCSCSNERLITHPPLFLRHSLNSETLEIKIRVLSFITGVIHSLWRLYQSQLSVFFIHDIQKIKIQSLVEQLQLCNVANLIYCLVSGIQTVPRHLSLKSCLNYALLAPDYLLYLLYALFRRSL